MLWEDGKVCKWSAPLNSIKGIILDKRLLALRWKPVHQPTDGHMSLSSDLVHQQHGGDAFAKAVRLVWLIHVCPF